MPAVILYLIKVNGVLLLFATTYYLVLRKLTFYRINRFYLLGALLFSSLYPMIDLTNLFYSQTHLNTEWVHYIPEHNLQSASMPGPVWQIILGLFYAGVAVMSFHFIIQLISLYHIHRHSQPDSAYGKKVRTLKSKMSPFTFWQTIYLNPALHNRHDLAMILAHERIHVKHWHSLDIMLAQISAIFYWFNPGIWLIRKFVRENLEFLTDEIVLQSGVEKKLYQYNVLKVEANFSSLNLANGFNAKDIRRRIHMMNVKRSSGFRIILYFGLVPLLLVLCLAFTISQKPGEQIKENLEMKMTPEINPQKVQPVNFDASQTTADSEVVKPGVRKKVENVKVKKIDFDKNGSDSPSPELNRLVKGMPLSEPNTAELKAEKVKINIVEGRPLIGRAVQENADGHYGDKTPKVITVVGYEIKPGEVEGESNIKYLKNNKPISGEAAKNINTAEIKEFIVNKSSPGKGEIKISTKPGIVP